MKFSSCSSRPFVTFFGRSMFFGSVLLVAACGGGTVGTGTGPSDSDAARVYAGSVSSTSSNAPISGVEVILESTGESAVTDTSGTFSLPSTMLGSEATFLLQNEQIDTSVSVTDIPAKSPKVSVQISVDTTTQIAQVSDIAAEVGIVGRCDFYFENNGVIRQANQVPPGTICTVGARLFGDGKALAAVPIALQRRACVAGAPWETIAETKSGTGINRGKATMDFLFEDSIDACKYRVVVPYNYGHFKPSYFAIQTFTEQGLLAK
jgi:hypothetical protein